MDADVLSDCWRHTKLESADNRVEIGLLHDDEDRILFAMDNLIQIIERISIGMLLNMIGEKDRLQNVTNDAIIDYVACRNGNDLSNNDDDENEKNQAPSRPEALRAVSLVTHYALSRSSLFNLLYSKRFTLQRRIKEEKIKPQKHLTLDKFLE